MDITEQTLDGYCFCILYVCLSPNASSFTHTITSYIPVSLLPHSIHLRYCQRSTQSITYHNKANQLVHTHTITNNLPLSSTLCKRRSIYHPVTDQSSQSISTSNSSLIKKHVVIQCLNYTGWVCSASFTHSSGNVVGSSQAFHHSEEKD